MKRYRTLTSLVFSLSGILATYAEIQLPELPDKEGMSLKGYVHDGENPLSGILVTDGYSFTETDESGAYYLSRTKGAEFVYLVTPAGYNAECTNGITQYYNKIDTLKAAVYQADFRLTATGDDTHHKFVVLGDPQMSGTDDHNKFKASALPDILDTFTAIKEEMGNLHVMVLGDIVFNTFATFPWYTAYWEGINLPMYHTPGNHDKHIITHKRLSSQEYRNTFGPLYYSFNRGKVHYIMLDNIYITGEDNCIAKLYPEAWEWVKKDLSYVPEGSTVILGMHQPITESQTTKETNKDLLDLLSKYNALILSSHRHLCLNLGNYSETVEERVQTALCGAYWFGDVAKDGTPLGYYIYEANGDSISWQFKPLGETVEKQFKMYPPVALGENYNFEVNVYDWDKHWSVTYKIDGEDMGTMVQSHDYDPYAYELYINHAKSWCRPVKTSHMFYQLVPNTAETFECHVVDRFGREYSQTYSFNAGVETVNAERISIYPNPTTDRVKVKVDTEIEQIELYNYLGGLVACVQDTDIIDLSGVATGYYIVRVTTTDGLTFNERVMKL